MSWYATTLLLVGFVLVAFSAVGESARPTSDWVWAAGFVCLMAGLGCAVLS